MLASRSAKTSVPAGYPACNEKRARCRLPRPACPAKAMGDSGRNHGHPGRCRHARGCASAIGAPAPARRADASGTRRSRPRCMLRDAGSSAAAGACAYRVRRMATCASLPSAVFMVSLTITSAMAPAGMRQAGRVGANVFGDVAVQAQGSNQLARIRQGLLVHVEDGEPHLDGIEQRHHGQGQQGKRSAARIQRAHGPPVIHVQALAHGRRQALDEGGAAVRFARTAPPARVRWPSRWAGNSRHRASRPARPWTGASGVPRAGATAACRHPGWPGSAALYSSTRDDLRQMPAESAVIE